MSDLTEEQRQALRHVLVHGMGEWSETNYAAGWLIDLEHILWHSPGSPEWRTVALLLGEWPVLREWSERQSAEEEHRWVSIDDWKAEHRCWHAEKTHRPTCPLEEDA